MSYFWGPCPKPPVPDLTYDDNIFDEICGWEPEVEEGPEPCGQVETIEEWVRANR